MQNSYSLLERSDERDVLPLAAGLGLGYTPFSPLAGGWLTGKYAASAQPPPGSRMAVRPWPYEQYRRPAVWEAIDRLRAHAAERRVAPAVLALAWVISDPRVTAVLVGPRDPSQLDAPVAALELALTADERLELAALFERV